MLFNSYEFIFCFLPITLVVFFGLARFRLVAVATIWLLLTSVFFYGYWKVAYLPLLLISVIGNFYFGRYINLAKTESTQAKVLLWVGVCFNLGILGYYKYAGFFVNSLNYLLQTTWNVPEILLPLAISFYSFTQIAYLVDAYRGETKGNTYDLLSYSLFVIFFPQLIAGPILRHDELIPQFQKLRNFVFSQKNIALGLTLFILGLSKKVLIADNVSPWVGAVFDNANQVSFIEAWVGAFSYTFQLYFDFSGYSDMAIGLGWMFNIRLPINFNSPYKAISIVDFWRRWHITLSNFLRDYLYIPLGGSRRGEFRRYVNLVATMLLGGLWHGAGWTYVVWGGLHGTFLAINHGWRKSGLKLPALLGWVITFTAVMFSWVVFRASSFNDAIELFKAMIGMKGIVLLSNWQGLLPWLKEIGVQFKDAKELVYLPPNYNQSLILLVGLLLSVSLLPNTQEIMHKFKPTWWWALSISGLALGCLLALNRVSEFLYFQF
ncbi:MAG: MBOAT family protein [Symploca sp. SIO2E9]|nr:MBOAT family protein [Symploca sp. SIO2E9]